MSSENYGRVSFTGELIGPYDTVAELNAELLEAHREYFDNYEGPCPACGGSGILSHAEARTLTLAGTRAESGYCPICEASGQLPPFGEGG